MLLQDSEIIDLVKRRPNADLIEQGKRYESLLKVLTEVLFEDELNNESGWNDIKETMRLPLTAEKFERTLDFVRLPLPIINIAEDILSDINKVFNARNANFSTVYLRKSQEQRGEKVLASLKIKEFIERNGKKVFKNKPNSFVVVDKDQSGNPFLIFVTNDMLRGIDFERNGDLKFIMFLHSTGKDSNGEFERIAFYDDTHYRVLFVQSGTYKVEINNQHNLTYTPAVPFLNIALNNSNPFNRYSPIARVVATMTDWVDFDVYIRYYEHYGIFPITEQPKPVCDDDQCNNGIIRITNKEGHVSESKCGTCSKSPIMGPGSTFLVDAASRKDELDVFGKIRYVSPPIENLLEAKKFQVERQGFIKVNVTGVNNVITKEAVNADQINAVMEDRRNPLLFLAKPLGDLDSWIHKTVIKLDMNVDVFRQSNYGTEWFLYTELEIQTLFDGAKKVGLPESVLDLYYRMLVETQYKNDPHTVRKLVIENNLNPAPYKTMDEAYKMQEKSVLSFDNLVIKANITPFVERFERENINIVEFGQDEILLGKWTFADKINEITKIFKTYIKDEGLEKPQPDGEGQQGNNQPG